MSKTIASPKQQLEIYNWILECIPEDAPREYLNVNQNKDSSISVRSRHLIVARVMIYKKKLYLEIKKKTTDLFSNCVIEYSQKSLPRIEISSVEQIKNMRKELAQSFLRISSAFAEDTFGCCHRYKACSEIGRCIHPNPNLAQACLYKRNLESGNNYYSYKEK